MADEPRIHDRRNWLEFLHQASATVPFEMNTQAGRGLQSAMLTFLKDAAAEASNLEGLKDDFRAEVARVISLLVIADHSGAPCRACMINDLKRLTETVLLEADAADDHNVEGMKH